MLIDEKPFPIASPPRLFRAPRYYYMIGQTSHFYRMLLALCLMRLATQVGASFILLVDRWSESISTLPLYFSRLGLGRVCS